MNILGIVAEFNPLHTGHEYLIQRLRRETGADFCVVAMSGDYVQRGEPAFFSKSLRTKAALLAGADLVLELPLSISTGSAEYFAQGAVSLLHRLGCITHLGFGSESGDIHAFLLAGALLTKEPAAYQKLLQAFLKKGMSFPKARYEALSAHLTEKSEDIADILSILKSPNNILGAEYVKALYEQNASMQPITLRRIGAGYHEEIADMRHLLSETATSSDAHTLKEPLSAVRYASASGLRKGFLSAASKESVSFSQEMETLLQLYVPQACRPLYLEALQKRQYVTFDDFFLPLYYTVQYSNAETLSRYQDVTLAFSKRLYAVFRQASSTRELCEALKTKHLTFSRINRSLLHILLKLAKDDAAAEKKQGFALYARILGFRKEAQPLLSLIKEKASIPILSKLADAPKRLSPLALSMLEQTIKASELYRAALPGYRPGSECEERIVIL